MTQATAFYLFIGINLLEYVYVKEFDLSLSDKKT